MLSNFFLLILGLCSLAHFTESLVNPCKKGLKAALFQAHPESREKYIQCSLFGQMFVFTCPHGLEWNQASLACDRSHSINIFHHTDTMRDQFPRKVETEPALFISAPDFTPTTTPTPMPQILVDPITQQSTPHVVQVEQTSSTHLQTEPLLQKGHCDTLSLSGSSFSIVNGMYSKISAHIYRRSDNLQVPGLIVAISPTQWCVTFSFATQNFDTLSSKDVMNSCGSGLECCMLISEGSLEIEDPSRAWIVNILENKGKRDSSIVITCNNGLKACAKLPFCPPECLKSRDGCDVCECNGVPFFKASGEMATNVNIATNVPSIESVPQTKESETFTPQVQQPPPPPQQQTQPQQLQPAQPEIFIPAQQEVLSHPQQNQVPAQQAQVDNFVPVQKLVPPPQQQQPQPQLTQPPQLQQPETVPQQNQVPPQQVDNFVSVQKLVPPPQQQQPQPQQPQQPETVPQSQVDNFVPVQKLVPPQQQHQPQSQQLEPVQIVNNPITPVSVPHPQITHPTTNLQQLQHQELETLKNFEQTVNAIKQQRPNEPLEQLQTNLADKLHPIQQQEILTQVDNLQHLVASTTHQVPHLVQQVLQPIQQVVQQNKIDLLPQQLLQNQELQTLKNFEHTVQSIQHQRPNEPEQLQIAQNVFANKLQAIEKQEVQNQVDNLKNLISSSNHEQQRLQPVQPLMQNFEQKQFLGRPGVIKAASLPELQHNQEVRVQLQPAVQPIVVQPVVLQNQNQQLQNQELQTLKNFEHTVQVMQHQRPNEPLEPLQRNFAEQVHAIEKQQIQTQVDKLNHIVTTTNSHHQAPQTPPHLVQNFQQQPPMPVVQNQQFVQPGATQQHNAQEVTSSQNQQLQNQLLKTLKNFEHTVQAVQQQRPNDQNLINLQTNVADKIHTIEKQQIQTQVDKLNHLIEASHHPNQQPQQQHNRPILIQTFQQQPQQPLQFQPNAPQQQVPVVQIHDNSQLMQQQIQQLQRQEVDLQARLQHNLADPSFVNSVENSQLQKQAEQLQHLIKMQKLQQQHDQEEIQRQKMELLHRNGMQPQKVPGISTLSKKMFASRLPRPITSLRPLSLEIPSDKKTTTSLTNNCTGIVCPQDFTCSSESNRVVCIKSVQMSPQSNFQSNDVSKQKSTSSQQIPSIQTFNQHGVNNFNQNNKITSQFGPSQQKNSNIQQSSRVAKTFPILNCATVKCSGNQVCHELSNCNQCNPMCFPPKMNPSFNEGTLLTCENIKCPTNFTCAKSSNTNKFHCVEKI